MDLIDRLAQATVRISNGAGHGAGIAWDSNGTIITNAHVLRGKSVRVADANGRTAARGWSNAMPNAIWQSSKPACRCSLSRWPIRRPSDPVSWFWRSGIRWEKRVR